MKSATRVQTNLMMTSFQAQKGQLLLICRNLSKSQYCRLLYRQWILLNLRSISCCKPLKDFNSSSNSWKIITTSKKVEQRTICFSIFQWLNAMVTLSSSKMKRSKTFSTGSKKQEMAITEQKISN